MSLTEANSGSRARDHLANERTYLAWVRTSLGALALAIAVERFGADGEDNTLLAFAVALMVMGAGLLVVATVRYFRVAKDLDEGLFHVDRTSPWVVLCGAVGLTIFALVVFLT